MNIRKQKENYIKDLTEDIKDASAVVLVDYAGLGVKMQQDLKSKLAEAGATMKVVKNTLFRLAGENAKLDSEALTDTALSGPTAIVVTKDDPIAPLQALAKFAKEFEVPQFKVGIIEGSFQGRQDLEKLSKLPAKEILVGQAVGAIGAPIYGLLATLQGNMQKLVFILQQASSKGGE